MAAAAVCECVCLCACVCMCVGGGGRRGVNLIPTCDFSKNEFSGERVKHWLFVTINIIISFIFTENFIENPQVVQKI